MRKRKEIKARLDAAEVELFNSGMWVNGEGKVETGGVASAHLRRQTSIVIALRWVLGSRGVGMEEGEEQS